MLPLVMDMTIPGGLIKALAGDRDSEEMDRMCPPHNWIRALHHPTISVRPARERSVRVTMARARQVNRFEAVVAGKVNLSYCSKYLSA